MNCHVSDQSVQASPLSYPLTFQYHTPTGRSGVTSHDAIVLMLVRSCPTLSGEPKPGSSSIHTSYILSGSLYQTANVVPAPIAALSGGESSVGPGGSTPFHTHDWEHVVYVLEGKGKLAAKDGDAEFAAGDALLTEPGEEHNFVNTGDTTLKFLCVVPLRGDA